MSKGPFDIDGLGKKVIEQFWHLNFIKKPSDIFNLNYNKIKKLEGWGDLSINNLKKAIEKSKVITLDRFIFSIGIRHIGQENAKINIYKLHFEGWLGVGVERRIVPNGCFAWETP